MISLFLASALLGAAKAATDTAAHGEALIGWLRSRGGTFNPKLEIRRADERDPTSRFGAFAKYSIRAKEILLEIPPDCLITAGAPEVGDGVLADFKEGGEMFDATVESVNSDGTYDVRYDDGDEESDVGRRHIVKEIEGEIVCGTKRNLIRELRLGDDSDFAPYVDYLLERSTSELPYAWSDAGRGLLEDVLGDELPPLGAASRSFHNECDDDNGEDPLEERAVSLLLQRAWDDVLVPVFDMVNHRNGRWLNTENDPVFWSREVVVRASRDIAAGEEIHSSYNLCSNCGNRIDHYGTPDILRDYGFVEQYPQRWFFEEYDVAFELDESDDTGSGDLEVSWLFEKSLYDTAVSAFEEQVKRLKELSETKLKSSEGVVPKNELDVIRQYCTSLIVALTHAIDAAMTECIDHDDNGACTAFSSDVSYDLLEEEEDDSEYGRDLPLPEYDTIEETKSLYQDIIFFQNPEDRDTCLQLDGIVQICGSYRPHYHEMYVHYTARFLDTVERVLFVGGGDSMLLHEIIKYPTLDLVVGLELDQTVTRKCFKHFGTQPHWDNPKVQWWYGDASKSLLMLPKDYFGSFDMVLVDLSETVMSMSVTEELDIMGALALLLKPEGILVKNELYLDQMSDIFDYTIQIHYYDVPVIFSQALSLGSYNLDFLARIPKDHNIEVLWDAHLEPLNGTEGVSDEIIHDYRRNSIRAKSHCKEQDEVDEEPTVQEMSPGIMMIVEAEDATAMVRPPEEMTEILKRALEQEGLTVVSTVLSPSGDKRVIILREGYVVARSWLVHKYCAFDIHLWSSFEKHESVKAALIAAVGSGEGRSSSSYRIVAGGMFGVSTWEQDEKNRGPRFTQLCDRPAVPLRDTQTNLSSVDIVLEESMSLVQESDAVVAVICGRQTQPCESLEVLENNGNTSAVIALWTCPSIENSDEYSLDGLEPLKRMLGCGKEVLETLEQSIAPEKKLGAIIVDTSAPIVMGQIVHKIFSSLRNEKRMLKDDIVVIAPMLDSNETWRRSFLDRFRRDIIRDEPVFRAEVLFNSSDSSMELGVTSSGDPLFVQHLVDAIARIENRSGLVPDVRKIQRGLFEWHLEFKPSEFFSPGDYDQTAPLEQWSSQQPLGHQTVFQLEMDTGGVIGNKAQANFAEEGEKGNRTMVSTKSDNAVGAQCGLGNGDNSAGPQQSSADFEVPMVCDAVEGSNQQVGHGYAGHLLTTSRVKHALREVLTLMNSENMSSAEVHEISDIGDGCVLIALWSEGSVIVLWDGMVHVDINLFMNGESAEDHDKFVSHFMNQIPMLKTVLRDEQPRGYGRVVNFLKDTEQLARVHPHWE